ncbi:MAG: Rieske (2Fe-2S) protein [Halosimplex sp.]
MDGTRVVDLDDLSTDDTFLFRVRSTDGNAVASGEAALRSDESTARATNGGEPVTADGESAADDDDESDDADDGIAMPDDVTADDDDDDVREAILLRLATAEGEPGEPVCWLNYCQHMTHINLDKGSGAPVRDGEVICTNHGALFEADSGECSYGPCEGAFLNEVDVAVADGGVYLADDGFEYVGEGPVENDDDLSSSSNVIL